MAREEQPIDSVFDILYSDTPRIHSLYAQLFNDGLLTSLRKKFISGETKGNTATVQGKIEANAGIPLIAGGKAEGNIGGAVKSENTDAEELEQNFDTRLTLVSSFLDRLDELGFIKRNIQQASIGSIVLISGKVSMLDIGFIQDIWDAGISIFSSQQPQPKQIPIAKTAKKQRDKAIGDLFKKLPKNITLRVVDESDQFWAILDGQHMISKPSSLALMHGSTIKGQWNILGILDAYPDSLNDQEFESIEPEEEILRNNALLDAYAKMFEAMRPMMGRPSSSYGITPLLIFREISRE